MSPVQAFDQFGVDTTNNAYRAAGHKTCTQCGSAFHSYAPKKFCSQACYHKSRVVRKERACIQCGKGYLPNIDSRKFCSVKCMRDARPKVGYQPRPRKIHTTACQQCGQTFRSAPSSMRKFCSYDCHILSGGARRAGDAAAMAKMKYGAKKDANHNEIFAFLGALTSVKDLSNAGCGVPDGLAWVQNGWRLFDVKNPNTAYGKRGLNKRQKTWAEDWRGGPVYLIYSIEDARLFAKGHFAALKQYPEPEAATDLGVPSYTDLHRQIIGEVE